VTFTEEHDKADLIFDSVLMEEQLVQADLGILAACSNAINMQALDLPVLNLQDLGERFTEDEILKVIRSMAPNKVSGPMGSPHSSCKLPGR
jgi:hypothetical protein